MSVGDKDSVDEGEFGLGIFVGNDVAEVAEFAGLDDSISGINALAEVTGTQSVPSPYNVCKVDARPFKFANILGQLAKLFFQSSFVLFIRLLGLRTDDAIFSFHSGENGL